MIMTYMKEQEIKFISFVFVCFYDLFYHHFVWVIIIIIIIIIKALFIDGNNFILQ